MAIYAVVHSCGHSQEHNIVGTNVHGERERKAEWLAALDCNDCQQAAKRAQRDVLAARATAVAGAEGWPELTGSERQMAWAQDIRASGIAVLAQQIKDETVLGVYVTAALRQTEARWWIDRRDLIRRPRNLVDLVDDPGVARYHYGSLAEQVEQVMTAAERTAVDAGTAPTTPETRVDQTVEEMLRTQRGDL